MSATIMDETVKAKREAMVPLRRIASPEDMADVALFLASRRASYVSGQDLVVDGGLVGGRLWTPHQEGVKAMRQAFGVDEI